MIRVALRVSLSADANSRKFLSNNHNPRLMVAVHRYRLGGIRRLHSQIPALRTGIDLSNLQLPLLKSLKKEDGAEHEPPRKDWKQTGSVFTGGGRFILCSSQLCAPDSNGQHHCQALNWSANVRHHQIYRLHLKTSYCCEIEFVLIFSFRTKRARRFQCPTNSTAHW